MIYDVYKRKLIHIQTANETCVWSDL